MSFDDPLMTTRIATQSSCLVSRVVLIFKLSKFHRPTLQIGSPLVETNWYKISLILVNV